MRILLLRKVILGKNKKKFASGCTSCTMIVKKYETCGIVLKRFQCIGTPRRGPSWRLRVLASIVVLYKEVIWVMKMRGIQVSQAGGYNAVGDGFYVKPPWKISCYISTKAFVDGYRLLVHALKVACWAGGARTHASLTVCETIWKPRWGKYAARL